MAKQRFANQASTLLATTLTDDALSLTVRLGDGSLFPNPTAGDWFLLTIQGNSLEFEIVKVTARSGDVMTIERAQEGTLALEWPAETPAVLRQTAGWLETVHTQDTFDPDEKVSGPESAVNEHLTVFDGTSGKVVKDGGSTIAQVIAAAAAAAPQGDVVGPASALSGSLPLFDGTTGKLLKDSGRDYIEAGTFTPGISFGGATTGITYSEQFGTYTKIGNVVFILIEIAMSNKGSSTGNAAVTGLPYTQADWPAPANSIVRATNMQNLVGSHIIAVGQRNTTNMLMVESGGATNNSLVITEDRFTDTSTLRLCGFFFLAPLT